MNRAIILQKTAKFIELSAPMKKNEITLEEILKESIKKRSTYPDGSVEKRKIGEYIDGLKLRIKNQKKV
jgi:hypothetical protein